jgi:hypothetical protein
MSGQIVTAIAGLTCLVIEPRPIAGEDDKFGVGVSATEVDGKPVATISIRHKDGRMLLAVLPPALLGQFAEMVSMTSKNMPMLDDRASPPEFQ